MKIGGMHWTILSRNIRFPFPIHFPMPNWSTLLEFISSGKISCDLADPHFLMWNKVYFHVNNSVKVILPRVSTKVCLNYVHVLYNVSDLKRLKNAKQMRAYVIGL